ncbi:hypothetical protein K3495_g15708 [Podosphaera aphanis]|nr:hypothetical protein K3495_g15708 [Podosphaera aphanis]
MSKLDFFSIFWEAFEKAFTEKNINSAWEKTGIWPFCPSMVQKDQEKKQESQEKLRRRREQATKKACEQAEKQNKRTIRVAAAEARKKAAAEKKAALASAREGRRNYNLTQLNINTDI